MMEKIRHGAGFLTSGVLAFTTDASVLWILTHIFGNDPYSARIVAIAAAMVVGYFAHRRMTFCVPEVPTLRQFGQFASIAAAVSALNYAIYAGILFAYQGFEPLAALLIASIVAMIASYLGLRFGVFKKPNA